jgi:hypothetical protein
LSHPSTTGSGRPFTAFRGSFQVRTEDGLQEMHVGLRSGQSVALTTLNLRAGVSNPVRVSLVYPADATPGHLLSVVPASQVAMVQDRERQLELARSAASSTAVTRPSTLPALPDPDDGTSVGVPSLPPLVLQPGDRTLQPSLAPYRYLPPVPPPPPATGRPTQSPSSASSSGNANESLVDRYQQALEAQQQMMRGLTDR